MNEVLVWTGAVLGSLAVLYTVVMVLVVIAIRASIRDWWG